MIIPSGVWRHYKGAHYQVLGVGQHTETKELVVVYVSLTYANMPGPRIRVRPLDGPEGFATPVCNKSPRAEPIPRFVYIGHEIPQEAK